MSNRIQNILLVIVFLSGLVSNVSAQTPRTEGVITKVNVYRGQALVTRNIEVNLPVETSELIVDNLPTGIIPESLYAVTSGTVKVLSVRYRQQAVREDTREEIRQLEAEIEQVSRQIKHAESEQEHFEQQWQMFVELKDFTIEAAGNDLNRGLLVFEPIESLTGLIEQKGMEYHQHRIELEDEIDQLKEEQELLSRQLQELTAGRSRTERQAVLFLSETGNERVTIELNYLVDSAGWQQQYNLRADPENSNVLIEYNAVVNQTSGEDWNSVAISLSTAEPTMVAAAPILDPMLVSLSSQPVPQQQSVQIDRGLEQQVLSFQQSRRENARKGIAANEELNFMATTNQSFIFNADQYELQRFKQQIAEISQTEGISVTYNLPGRLTLPSRSDQQLVSIASITAQADFTLIATPLLTDFVYLQADLLNDSQTVLLPGQSNMFCADEFVGKANVPLVTIGQTFTAGFGIDSQVQVTHELEDKQTRIQGGNRIDTYSYRIALSNYKNTLVELRLLDRLPYTENNSIKIEIAETEPELSKDSEYNNSLAKKGILRWDLNLPANTINQEATVVSYSFTMEYDRNMNLETIRSALSQ
ncbi:mucoidy inhibitor MuiA family protein [Planctomycetota bacterium]